MSAKAGSSRVLDKLNTCLLSGNYYEAHQMYRTLYFRYSSQQKYLDAMDLLFTGSSRLLQLHQFNSGLDLASLLIETLSSSSQPVSSPLVHQIGSLFKLMYIPNASPEQRADRSSFLHSVLKWSKQVSPEFKYGHPSLHQEFATILWRSEQNLREARYHFLLSDDGEGCGSFLVAYHSTLCLPSELDLLIAQTVLQFLCHRNPPTALQVLRTYTQEHPSILPKEFPFLLPLLNFLWLLLLLIEKPSSNRLSQFSILVEKYQRSIERDPCYKEYLDRIAQIFFGVPPPRREQQGGLLANLIQGLMGESDSEEEVPALLSVEEDLD